MPGYEMHKDDVKRRLRRVEGQVRGIQRMVDEDTYCIDVLTQIAAVNRALQGVALGLLHDHLGHCVSDAVKAGGAEGPSKVGEATAAIERLLKA